MGEELHYLVEAQASFISQHQLPSGAIPWYEGGLTDPWDHIECAIALDLAGRFAEAGRAYDWLKDKQNADGSWYYHYLNNEPQDLTKDTNFSSYIATGVWCHYLATRDIGFLSQMWNTIEKSVAFVINLQQPGGEITWALSAEDAPWPGALLAASSCTWQSIGNGVRIAKELGFEKPNWHKARERLAKAIKERPELFDKLGENEQGFAMHWYYPVLNGVIDGREAKRHISEQWHDFIIDNWGCKCVSSAPWVTVAETCELIMALSKIGDRDKARLLLDWVLQLQDPDGGFKTGIKIPEQLVWPEEKYTWTSAAVIMALIAQTEKDEAQWLMNL